MQSGLDTLLGEVIDLDEYDTWRALRELSPEDREAAILEDWLLRQGDYAGWPEEDPFWED